MLLPLLRGRQAISQANWLPTTSLINQCRNATSKSSVLGALKKPRLSPYSAFIIQEYPKFRDSQPTLLPKQVLAAIGARWSAMDSESKEKFKVVAEEIYAERLKVYESKQQDFLGEGTPQQLEEELDRRSKRRKLLKVKREIETIENSLGKPRGVPNAFGLYVRELNKSSPTKLRLVDWYNKWLALSEQEKEKYQNLRSQEMEKYITSKKEYEQRLREDKETSEKLNSLREKKAVLIIKDHE